MSVSDVAGVNVDQMLISSLHIRFINWFNAPTLRSLESSIHILSSFNRSLDRCSTPVRIVTAATITFTKAAVLIQVLDASHLRFDASSASNNLNYISCGLTLFIPS